MTTLRSHDQFNTTIYGLDDRYRGIFHGRRVVLINDDDLKESGWKAGDRVDITSHFQQDGKRNCGGRTALRSCHIRFLAAALRPIFPRPMCWFPSAASRSEAILRLRKQWS